MIILFFASVSSWWVIFERWTTLSRTKKDIFNFEKYFWSQKELDSVFKNISKKVEELAITVFDPDAPTGCGFWHWILVGIDKKYCEITDECLSKSLQVQNDFGSYGYGGPCPPENDHPHRYFFTIYGLNSKIEAHKDTPAAQIAFQLHFKTFEKATLLGLFKR